MSNFVSDNEQGLINICINVPVSDFEFDRDVTFNFASAGVGTASNYTQWTLATSCIASSKCYCSTFFPPDTLLDIIVISTFQTQTINSASPNVVCQSATIRPDDRVEEDEFLEVTLEGGDSIDLLGGNARMVITDDDGERGMMVW